MKKILIISITLICACNNATDEKKTDNKRPDNRSYTRTHASYYGLKGHPKHIRRTVYEYITNSKGDPLPVDSPSPIFSEHFYRKDGNLDSVITNRFIRHYEYKDNGDIYYKLYTVPDRKYIQLIKTVNNSDKQYTSYGYKINDMNEIDSPYIYKELHWLDFDYSVIKTRTIYSKGRGDVNENFTRSGDTTTHETIDPNNDYNSTTYQIINTEYDNVGNPVSEIITNLGNQRSSKMISVIENTYY